MSLTAEEVKNIAHLARLSMKEEDIQTYADKLSGILDLVAQMDAVDTSAVEPMAHSQDVMQRLRTDVVTETNQRDQFQKNSPAIEKGLFLVPQVIE